MFKKHNARFLKKPRHNFVVGIFVLVLASACSNKRGVYKDGGGEGGSDGESLTFEVPRVTLVNPVSPSNNQNPKLGGTAQAQTIVHIFEGNACVGALLGQGSANSFATGKLAVSFPENATTEFSAQSIALDGRTSLCGHESGYVFVEDSIAPASLSISAPASSPHYSNTNSVTVSGTCETGTSVLITGDFTTSIPCIAAAFSTSITKVVDGTYNFTLKQRDAAGNNSPNSSVQWVRDASIPATPVISSPVATPYFSKIDNLTIAGTCTTGFTVTLGGDASQNQICSSGSFSFAILQSVEDNYDYTITQTNLVGVNSGAASFNWTLDKTAPVAPLVTIPATTPISNSSASITLSGNCESGATVNITGSYANSSLCAAGSFSFSHTPAGDGTYNYSITQTDRAANTSASTARQWTRDTSIPATPTITAPASSPHLSTNGSLPIAGTCTAGLTVSLSGDATDSQTCTGGGTYSFVVNKGADGTYNFAIVQQNAVGTNSAAANQQWILDSSAPAVPVILVPAATPYLSGASVLTISGSCESNATVKLRGDDSQDFVCAASAFSFTVNKGLDGTYNFTVKQQDPAGNQSGDVTQQWTRDASVPDSPTINAPVDSPYFASANNLTISGDCTDGLTVELSGSATQSQVCAASVYSFAIINSTEGSFSYSLLQRSLAGVPSGSVTQDWTLDKTAPAAPTITLPASTPYLSNAVTLSISGACESDAIVSISGSHSGSTTCAASSYSFTHSPGADGVYNYTISQTDLAGNSSGNQALQWTRDTSIPAAPVVTSPAASPYRSNVTTLNVSGTCTNGMTVYMSGSASGSYVCSGSAFNFSVLKTIQAAYNFAFNQRNGAGTDSAAANLQWVLDQTAPAAIVLSNPAVNPYTSSGSSFAIAGSCETGATVRVRGDDSQDLTCAAGTFSGSIGETLDNIYTYQLTQVDVAGNESAVLNLQWTRDSGVPTSPVITTPATSPYYSNLGSITIAGTCDTGFEVELSGDSTQNQTCTASAFSFVVNKGSDASYSFSVLQKNLLNVASGTVSVNWIRDTVAPSAIVISTPAATPYSSNSTSLTIGGSCEDNATVNISGSYSSSVVCAASAFSFNHSPGADGTYNYTLTQSDQAGNISASAAQQWTRDTALPAAPVITLPAVTPFYSATTNLTLSGTCVAGFTVDLTGSATGSQTCTGGGTFSFATSQTVDGNYNYSITQSNLLGSMSLPDTQSWTLDRVAPNRPVMSSSSPASPGSSLTPSIIGSAEANSTLSLYTNSTCTSSVLATGSAASFSGAGISVTVPLGPLTRIYGKAIDQAGNISACSTTRVNYQFLQISLVKDIRTYGGDSSTPNSALAFGGLVYFTAEDGIIGRELWKTDGTGGGTVLVEDLNPSGSADLQFLTAAGSQFFFSANHADMNRELWISDGTTSSVVLDINPESVSSTPLNLFWTGTKLFFTADNGTTGRELWVSDGTALGTTLVKDITAGSTGTTFAQVIRVGELLFFYVDDRSGSGSEPWISDGTNAGTFMLKDINPGSAASGVASVAVVGSEVLFSANDPTYGLELWKTDGTTVGTVLVKDIRTGTSASTPAVFAVMNNILYFRATNGTGAGQFGTELWSSDGTTAGTVLVKDVRSGTSSSTPALLTVVGNTLYFTATNGTLGTEWFTSDGTNAGTVLLKDINVGSGNSIVANAFAVGSKLYFRLTDATSGVELWVSDGTSAGTGLVKDIWTGVTSSTPTSMAILGTNLIFSAMDSALGLELFSSDGTTGGTNMLKDINLLTTSGPTKIGIVNGLYLFSALESTNGRELWATDGTTAGTVLVKDINPGTSDSAIASPIVMNNIAYFAANDGTNGLELWRSDGTTAGTYIVKDINAGAPNSTPGNFLVVGSKIYFSAITATNGAELWESDGTSGGTVLLKDIISGSGSSSPTKLVEFGAGFLFSASATGTGAELHYSDLTGAGTVLVKDILAGSTSSSISDMVAFGSYALFRATDGTSGSELFITDGTLAGTQLLMDINPGTAASTPRYFTAYDATRIVFQAADADGTELWITDGTVLGTSLLVDIRSGVTSSSPSGFTKMGSWIYFSADNGTQGSELWRTDGTIGGTSLFKEIRSGSGGSGPGNFLTDGTTLYFTANDGVSDAELYKSDGTVGATAIIQEINIYGTSSVSNMILFGSDLLFNANDGVKGGELWKFDN